MNGRAYYNEIDGFCADWLRRLIAAGHIAPGDVDERSILEVRPDDLKGYTQCHFFAGLGAWSYALRLAGWDDARPVWTGSCPCQPFSVAGKGEAHEDERHLWPAWFRLIGELGPGVLFGEQVASAAGRAWLDHVLADLESRGYAAAAADLPAAGVGAPHRRQRLWFVADAGREREQRVGLELAAAPRGNQGQGHQRQWLRPDAGDGGDLVALADTDLSGLGAGGREGLHCARRPWSLAGLGGADGTLADTDLDRLEARRGVERGAQGARGQDGHDADRRGDLGDACGAGLPARERAQLPGPQRHHQGRAVEQPGRAPWADIEWLACADGKARPTGAGIFPLADGAAARVGRLRAYGNAIVPQVAAAFIEAYCDARGLT